VESSRTLPISQPPILSLPALLQLAHDSKLPGIFGVLMAGVMSVQGDRPAAAAPTLEDMAHRCGAAVFVAGLETDLIGCARGWPMQPAVGRGCR
jgi:hypothetical protein